LRLHAKGGLGEVFLAHDEELHRQVALKQIQDRHADDPTYEKRFGEGARKRLELYKSKKPYRTD